MKKTKDATDQTGKPRDELEGVKAFNLFPVRPMRQVLRENIIALTAIGGLAFAFNTLCSQKAQGEEIDPNEMDETSLLENGGRVIPEKSPEEKEANLLGIPASRGALLAYATCDKSDNAPKPMTSEWISFAKETYTCVHEVLKASGEITGDYKKDATVASEITGALLERAVYAPRKTAP